MSEMYKPIGIGVVTVTARLFGDKPNILHCKSYFEIPANWGQSFAVYRVSSRGREWQQGPLNRLSLIWQNGGQKQYSNHAVMVGTLAKLS